MKLLIAGGGTGGHVFPALAIAQELSKSEPKSNILFVGTKRGLESKIIPRHNYNISFIRVRGIKRSGIKNLLLSLFEIPYSIFRSIIIIWQFKPNFVLGVGGYASGPTIIGAVLLFKKTAIMEQNSIPGITNRILSKFVKKIFISYDSNLKYFPPAKTLLTGNPVSPFFLDQLSLVKNKTKETSRSSFILTVLGGSQGASNINWNIVKMLKLYDPTADIEIIHQCGHNDFNQLKKEYEKMTFRHTLKPFFENMPEIYLKSDLIICRAGAMTISEIQITGKPSILIPLKTAADNHQELNGYQLLKNNASILIKEDELTPEVLFENIQKLILNPKILHEMAQNARNLALPDAAKKILTSLSNME